MAQTHRLDLKQLLTPETQLPSRRASLTFSAKFKYRSKGNSSLRASQVSGATLQLAARRLETAEGARRAVGTVEAATQRVRPQRPTGSLVEIKVLERWLNNMLQEACFTEKFDTGIAQAALKKFGIDRNTLRSRSISDENVDRLFKSLYVYSMGFNSLVGELTAHMWKEDGLATKTMLWKVFSSLLEYCSRGEFETMIGEMDRDKNRKLNSLKEEILRRERVIQDLEKSFSEKNEKVLSQIRALTLEKEALALEKNILEEDFRQTDRAFNQEVAVRLKFEHKINEIHGVHRELTSKHERLYLDHGALKESLNAREETIRKLKRSLEEQAAELGETREQLELKSEEGKQQQRLIEECRTQLRVFSEKSSLALRNFEEANISRKHEERVSESLRFELDSSSKILDVCKKSEEQLQAMIRGLVEESHRDKHEVLRLKDEISALKSSIFDRDQRSLGFETRQQFLTEKLAKTTERYNKTLDENSALAAKAEELRAEAQFEREKIKMLESRLSHNDRMFEQLRKANSDLSDEVQRLTADVATFKFQLNMLADKQRKLELALGEKTDLAENRALRIKDLQIQLQVSTEKFKKQVRILKEAAKVAVEKQERSEEELKSTAGQLTGLRREHQDLQAGYQRLNNKLKDEQFQLQNVRLKFNQSLLFLESEKEYFKQLTIELTTTKLKNESVSRELHTLEARFKDQSEQHQQEVEGLTSRLDRLVAESVKRREYCHPLLLEDALSQCTRLAARLQSAELKYSELATTTMDSRQQQLLQEVSRLGQELRAAQDQAREQARERDTGLDQSVVKAKKVHQQLAQLRHDLDFKEVELEESRQQLARTNNLLTIVQNQNSQLQRAHAQREKELGQLQDRVAQLRAREDRQSIVEEQLQKLRGENVDLQFQLRGRLDEIGQLSLQLSALREQRTDPHLHSEQSVHSPVLASKLNEAVSESQPKAEGERQSVERRKAAPAPASKEDKERKSVAKSIANAFKYYNKK